MQLTVNALTVLERRYLARDEKGNIMESSEDLFRRVAHHIASAEEKYPSLESIKDIEEEFYKMMTNLEFLPNSPTLMNAGRDLGQLSACFVLPVEDSMEGIFEAVKNAALIHKSGGGTGFSFTRLRGKGSTVASTGGVASGPISFMKVFNSATEAVKQGGKRRGANMGILRIDHPDILEFIKCKENSTELNNFNISVGLTEEFMKAVEENREYDLLEPRTKRTVGKLNAKEIFDTIVSMAWTNGEPGIVFLDRINRDNIVPEIGEIESTNPCLHPETFISTKNGLEKIKDLYEKHENNYIDIITDNRVVNRKVKYNGREYYENGVTLRKAKVFKTGIKNTLSIRLNNGQELKVTPDHKIFTTKEWIAAKNLQVEDEILVQSGKGFFAEKDTIGEDLGLFIGWVTGDGWLTSDEKVIGMVFANEEKYIMEKIQEIAYLKDGGNGIVNQRENNTWQLLFKRKDFVNSIKHCGIQAKKAHEKRVPDPIFTASEKTVGAFLNGLFSSDGTINYIDENHRDIRLTSSSFKLLQDVQLLLLNLGIYSNIYSRSKEQPSKFRYITKEGEERVYDTKPHFELIINGNDICRFKDVIGDMVHVEKNKKLDKINRESRKNTKYISKVVEIIEEKESEVYDISEQITHSLIANGIVVHNCGEQPLLPFESCNLGSINLSKMVKHENEKAKIDYDRLGEVVDLAVRFLDNVIEVNKYPLKEIEEMTKSNRKIGLGVMGFADMLVELGVGYNSEAGVKVAKDVMKFIDVRSKEKSIDLARERGIFPNYNKSIFRQRDVELRNGTTTTIAPTGSISIIAGTSSGIEPLFALCYYRNVMDDDKLIEVNPLFKEYLKAEGIYSEELMEKVAEKGSIHDIKEIPEYIKKIFVTAHDISPEWHIKMQASFQEHVDNAVSKTVNFENHATKEEVAEVYMLAYKLGCKGITIYRDGSRDGQVLNIGKLKDNKIEEAAATEVKGIIPRSRPKTTMGITEKVRIGCGNLYITANYDEKGICEVFTNLGRAGGCPSQSEATSRLISIALRAGISAEAIIEQLKGIRCHSTLMQRGKGDKGINVLSCPDAIGKALEKVMNMNILEDEKNVGDIAREIENEESKSTDDCATCTLSDTCDNIYTNEISMGMDESLEEGKTMRYCPECGAKVEHEGGCVVCRSCGYSKCG